MFINILEVSFFVSIIIIVILIMSNFLNKKYSIKWRYFIWLGLSIRLIIPFNYHFEETPVKITIPKNIETNLQTIETAKDSQPINEVDTQQSDIKKNININNSKYVVNKNETTTLKKSLSKVPLINILVWCYVVGAIIFISYQLIIYNILKISIIRSSRIIKEKDIIDICNNIKLELGIKKIIFIQLNQKLESPMVIGLFRPILLLNNLEYEKCYLEMIIRHEMVHIKRNDIAFKTIMLLAKTIHWFNPFVHLMSKVANKDIELACDEAVVRFRNREFKKIYSHAILSAINNTQRMNEILLPLHRGKTINPFFSTHFSVGGKMMKKRFENIFNADKKRKGIVMLVVMFVMILLVGLNVSFSKNTDVKNSDIIYTNEKVGFSLKFPQNWRDKYTIEEIENGINVWYKKEGVLFTINRIKGQQITQEDLSEMIHWNEIIIKQGNGYTYTRALPGDVQCPNPDTDKIGAKEYLSMYKDIDKIVKSISLIGKDITITKNGTFQFWSNVYFDIEIPVGWKLEQIDKVRMKWVIKNDEQNIGYIRRTSSNTKDEVDMKIFFINSIDNYEIYLLKEYRNTKIAETILNSIKLKYGPMTYVDMEESAQEYIDAGGKKVFGVIKKANYDEETLTSVLIQEMKFVEDENEPNDASIEMQSLDVVEYTAGFSPQIVLEPTDGKIFTQEKCMPIMDEYLKEYDYKNKYYDFIIGRDGEIKYAFEKTIK